MFFHLTPDKGAIEQHVGAVRGMHRRTVRFQGVFCRDHERQQFIADVDFFRGVFGERAAVGDDRHHPFAGITHLPDRQRMTPHQGRVESVHQRIGRGRELLAGENIVHARHRQRGGCIDRNNARRRMRRRQHRDMQHAFERDVGDEIALARDKTAILADPAIGRNKAECFWVGVHFASASDLSAGAFARGVLATRMRSAANCTASIICP